MNAYVQLVDFDDPAPRHNRCGDFVEDNSTDADPDGVACKTCGPIAMSEVEGEDLT